MTIPFTNVDVFTSTRYLGNPLSIIRPKTPTTLTQTQKLAIAKEFNLSEIVFLHLPENDTSPTELTVDIFTSHAEIPFAGHPTIGTTFFVLNYLGLNTVNTLITKAGRIPISKSDDGKRVQASIPHDFHEHDVTVTCDLQPSGEQNKTVSIVNGMAFTVVELPDLEALAKANKNLNASTYDTSHLDEGWRNGLVGTMYYVSVGEDSTGRKRYRTRMFGTREDPGTGSASCGLSCYLALKEGKGKEVRFSFEQGVEMGKKNDISVDVTTKSGEEGIEKVVLSGEAVRVMEGHLEVP